MFCGFLFAIYFIYSGIYYLLSTTRAINQTTYVEELVLSFLQVRPES